MLVDELIDPADLLVGQRAPILRRVALDITFQERIHVIAGKQPDLARLSDDRGIVEHHLPQLDVDPPRQQRARGPPCRLVVRVDAQGLEQRVAGELGIVGLEQFVLVGRIAGRIDLGGIEIHLEMNGSLEECRPSLADDRGEQHDQKDQAKQPAPRSHRRGSAIPRRGAGAGPWQSAPSRGKVGRSLR